MKFRIPVEPSALGAGLGVVVLGVLAVLYIQRGAHTELTGAVLKVRTLATDENSSIAIADFRFVNPSDYPFVVREVAVSIEDKNGKIVEGYTVSEVDARRVFEAYPQLGQKYNDTLVIKNKIPARQSWDRMVAARFEIPESELQSRKRLIVRIVDLDGPSSELQEKK